MSGQSIRVILLSFLLVPIYCSAYGGSDEYISDGMLYSFADLSLLSFAAILLIIRDGASRARSRFHGTVPSVQSYRNGTYICS